MGCGGELKNEHAVVFSGNSSRKFQISHVSIGCVTYLRIPQSRVSCSSSLGPQGIGLL